MALLENARRSLNIRQLHALQLLWKWRDQTARVEDESLQYVLPDHTLYHICEILPREVQGILACCSPVPSLVKRDVFQIHRLVFYWEMFLEDLTGFKILYWFFKCYNVRKVAMRVSYI
jgi:exosome complex exonuclease RRP6